MENNVIEMKKENKVTKWFKDHDAEIILCGSLLTVTALLAAVYAAGVKNGKGPKIDEWIPVPFDSDGKIGVSMLGVRNLSGGGAALIDTKDYLFEKNEYAANFANNMLHMIKEAGTNS